MSDWNSIEDFIEVYNKMKEGSWTWSHNPKCKYINLRVDMRDGGCLIKDRDDNLITPEDLNKQSLNKVKT